MNNKFLACLLLGIFGLISCHKQRPSKSAIPAKDSIVANGEKTDYTSTPILDSVKIVSEALKIQEISFNYLTAKSRFSFRGAQQDFDNTNVNIRMKRDSLIWVSVTGVGFEVARGLISRDSIVFMDKFHKDYFVFSYKELSRQYHFELSFDLLQSIILGNLPFEFQENDVVKRENDFMVMKQNVRSFEVNNYISVFNQKLTQLRAQELPLNNTFSLDYEDFRRVGSFLFPFTSFVKLAGISPKDQKQYNTTMHLKHIRVDLTDQNPGFPFNVPSGYSRKR
jgi:hypothetical protein